MDTQPRLLTTESKPLGSLNRRNSSIQRSGALIGSCAARATLVSRRHPVREHGRFQITIHASASTPAGHAPPIQDWDASDPLCK